MIRGTPRTINMSTIGDALLAANDPPIRAIYVYNSNPVAVAPESSKVQAGFARDDLFCVVHEIFQTDTADYADILLPATTQLEQLDIHSSYGHLYALANNPAIAPLGEAKPNTEVFRLLAARMGFTEPCFRDSDDDLARQAFLASHPRAAGLDWDALKATGFKRLAVPDRYAPFAEGNFPTPSGKCEFYSAAMARDGHDPLPTFVPPRESVASNPALAQRYPLAFLSPPARNFLNSSFANLPTSSPKRRRRTSTSTPTTRPRAGSQPGSACGSSTIAEPSRQRRASATARAPASSSRRRSGGRSSRRTGRTRTT